MSDLKTEQNAKKKADRIPIRFDLFRALVDHADHGITIAEREGDDTILLYVNQAFEKMTGYTSDECLYKDCRFLQKGEEQKETGIITKAIDDEVSVSVILKNYRKDGTLFWNDLSITPFYDEVDSVMYYIGIQKDISHIVAVQEKLTETKFNK